MTMRESVREQNLKERIAVFLIKSDLSCLESVVESNPRAHEELFYELNGGSHIANISR